MAEITSNGWNIHYETVGNRQASPLVMVPGYSHRIAHWDGVPAALAEQFFVVLMDCRGMGQSERRDEPFTIPDEAQDVVNLLDALSIPQAHVLGFSRGGFVAQEVALAHSERVLSLVLCGTSHRGPGSVEGSEEFRKAMQFQPGQTIEDFYRRLTEVMGAPGWPERDPAAFEACVAVDVEGPPRRLGLRRQQEAIGSWTSHGRLQKLKCPVLVVAGENDGVMPPENSRQLSEMIPGAEFKLIAECGHQPMWEKPDEVVAAVSAFLRRSLTGRQTGKREKSRLIGS